MLLDFTFQRQMSPYDLSALDPDTQTALQKAYTRYLSYKAAGEDTLSSLPQIRHEVLFDRSGAPSYDTLSTRLGFLEQRETALRSILDTLLARVDSLNRSVLTLETRGDGQTDLLDGMREDLAQMQIALERELAPRLANECTQRVLGEIE